MCKVAILLTTYQSEMYLSQLLDSLLVQTHKDWILYIRDDLSTDETSVIIDKYVSAYSNIVNIKDPIKRGAKDGFLWLLNQVVADYYLFCDHDDIWLPKKIERIYRLLDKETSLHPSTPIVVHSDLVVVDSDLNIISNSYWAYTRLDSIVDKPSFLKYCNFVTGCAMGFNDAAKIKALSEHSHYISMHDAWIALCTLKNKGLIIPIHESLILYRQHGKNTLGATKYKPTMMTILKNWRRIFVCNYEWFRMLKELLNLSLIDFIVGKIEIYKMKCI